MKTILTSISATAMLAGTSLTALADNATNNGSTDNTMMVTATRLPEKISDEPVNVTVITRQDIERSAATTPQELLAGVAGITTRNMDSSDNTSVDLRGFGVTGPANTLILIDGLPINDNDLSAPLLSTLSLDRVERIEIVRGSSLAYGGGSSGGVINIITRKGRDGEVAGDFGSHRTSQIVMGKGVGDTYTLRLDGQDGRTDGYRSNDEQRTHSGEIQAGWHDAVTHLLLDIASDRRTQGFPGTRSVNPTTGVNQLVTDPWGTATPLDNGETDSTRYALRGDGKLAGGDWAVDVSRRYKTTNSFYDDYGVYVDRRNSRDDRFSPRYALPLGSSATLSGGLDWRHTSASDPDTQTGSSLHAKAAWVSLGASVTLDTRVTVGGRDEQVTQSAINPTTVLENTLHAWELGVRQNLTQGASLFVRTGESYRLPNADELALDPGLLPQTSHDLEIGLDGKYAGGEAHVGWFRMDVDNEIAYQPYVNGNFGNNINLSPTRHQGTEASWLARSGAYDLGINATWLAATFRSGNYGGLNVTGNRVPLVPTVQGNVQFGYAWSQADRMDLQWHLSGRSRMDNDEVNQGSWLAGYSTLDLKLTHSQGPWRVSLSARNLTNHLYASYGIVSTGFGSMAQVSSTSAYSIYPEEGRNWLATVAYKF